MQSGKDALNIQPSALELSVNASIFCLSPFCLKVRFIVIADAMNSNKLIESFPLCFLGISNRQAKPSSLKPPIPCSQASEKAMFVGVDRVMLLMSTPCLLARVRRVVQSLRSAFEASSTGCGP